MAYLEKIVMRTQEAATKVAAFKLLYTERRLKQSTGLFLRRDDTLAYLEKFVTRTQEPLINVVAISLV